ncbi:hypothetical protein [Limnofasciculus baicalensis]|uniref:Uncharacterized protein n=1 Tax=Limnofasciculus baicalensis BBK-W-15 TaxID=2699891 RepID=A0AAE3GVB8_9CYAN|nr:hypothetical protein [Limnofasciculus baicalensis]MCP2730553.1 hypothetical protein [Limnofasciculus baicalensis BBK-W-15]
MIEKIAAISAITLSTLLLGAISIQAQPSPQNEISTGIELNRAKNLARMAVERENGGLGNYRAEASMHGLANQAPYVENSEGSWTFTFKGRRPMSSIYNIESVVTVDQNGTVTIDSNGPIRQ